MPATPLTIEGRAIAERMRNYSKCEGNLQYQQQLIYVDSQFISTQLIPAIEAVPDVDYALVQSMYFAAATCGSTGECGGNIGLWPLMISRAAELELGLDAIDAVPEPAPEQQKTGAVRPRL